MNFARKQVRALLAAKQRRRAMHTKLADVRALLAAQAKAEFYQTFQEEDIAQRAALNQALDKIDAECALVFDTPQQKPDTPRDFGSFRDGWHYDSRGSLSTNDGD